MKKCLYFFGLIMMAASCTTINHTASNAEMPAQLLSSTVADLEVSNQRVSYTFDVPKEIRRGGLNNIKQAAMQAALEKAGADYDLLLEPQYQVSKKHYLIRSKITKMTVTGRPAKYKNFHSLNDTVWCNRVFRAGYENKVKHGKLSTIR